MSALFDPTDPLTATGNLKRRETVSRAVVATTVAAAAVAVAVLAIVVFGVAQRGASQISWSFLTTSPTSAGPFSGGIASAIVGTALIVAFATAMALPLGALVALFLAEFSGPDSRLGKLIKLGLDLMQGLPTIVVGLFVFTFTVKVEHAQSGFAASIALAIIALPLIARSSIEVLRLVPRSLRDAADALGVSRWRTVLTVILPAASGGILTGTVLAIARTAGETAPLIALDSIFDPGMSLQIFGKGIPNLPISILTAADNPSPEGLQRAWGAALALLTMILLANIGSRVLLARSRKKNGL